MNIGRWYVRTGRIDRPTYWLHYFVPLVVVYLILEFAVVIPLAASAGPGSSAPTWPVVVLLLVYLLLMPPMISSQVTRLHDRGHSAWWLLFSFLPIAGPIVLLVQMCLPGDPGQNRYGPPPAPRDVVPEPPYPSTYTG